MNWNNYTSSSGNMVDMPELDSQDFLALGQFQQSDKSNLFWEGFAVDISNVQNNFTEYLFLEPLNLN